jgi:hypothetical protein
MTSFTPLLCKAKGQAGIPIRAWPEVRRPHVGVALPDKPRHRGNSDLGPKPTNFVACGWSGIEGSPDFASAILRPQLVTHSGRFITFQAPQVLQ